MDPTSDDEIAFTIAKTYGISPRTKCVYDADKWQYESYRWIKFANRHDRTNCLIKFAPDELV